MYNIYIYIYYTHTAYIHIKYTHIPATTAVWSHTVKIHAHEIVACCKSLRNLLKLLLAVIKSAIERFQHLCMHVCMYVCVGVLCICMYGMYDINAEAAARCHHECH